MSGPVRACVLSVVEIWNSTVLYCTGTGIPDQIMCGGALMFALVGAAAQMRVRIDFYGECV